MTDILVERLANELETFSKSLTERECLLLHRMIWMHLDPVDRVRFSDLTAELDEGEEAILRQLEAR